MDVRTPFTRAYEVVDLLRLAHLDGDEIIGFDDFALSPVAAELHRQVYFPQKGADGSFAIWNRQRHQTLPPADLLAQIEAVVRRGGHHRAVLVLNVPVVDLLPGINVSE